MYIHIFLIGAVEAAGIPIVTVVFGSSTGSVNFKGKKLTLVG